MPDDLARLAPSATLALPDAQPGSHSAPAIYLASLAPGEGRRVQAGALRSLLRLLGVLPSEALPETPQHIAHFPWASLDYGRVVALRGLLQEAALAPATKGRMWAALRGVLREAWRLGQLSDVEWHRIADVRGKFGRGGEVGRALSDAEVLKLVTRGPDDSFRTACNRGIFVAGAFAGLRRSEIVALDMEDYRRDALHVRKGKGAKARTVPLGKTAQGVLDHWIVFRGTEPGPLFCGFGTRRLRRLGASTIALCLDLHAAQSGVFEPFSPHDLRRTYITRLLERGADVITVSKLAGHESVDTTKKYDKRGEEAKRKAIELLE